jgi:hypothetical protein
MEKAQNFDLYLLILPFPAKPAANFPEFSLRFMEKAQNFDLYSVYRQTARKPATSGEKIFADEQMNRQRCGF